MTVGYAFDESVAYYDRWMKTALPRYDELFQIAVDLIPFERSQPIHVLDLGAGTGLFSHHLWQKYLQAKFTLYDIAAKMLDVARLRFKDQLDQFQFELIDHRDVSAVDSFDVVISSLSIHHLDGTEKKALFAAIFKALRRGGAFINVDQIRAPTQELRELYWSNWLAHLQKQGAADEQVQASIQRRVEYDRDDLLIDQLRWLSEAGFEHVDLIYKHYFMGVFYAQK
jgi:tRNA (cmo5U34)-methyltransferase